MKQSIYEEIFMGIQDIFVPYNGSDGYEEGEEDNPEYNPSMFHSDEELQESIDYMNSHQGERYIGFWQYDMKRQLFVPIFYKVK